MLELKIRTLDGDCDWYCVSEDCTITELKKELYNASGTAAISFLVLPDPLEQNFLYRGRSLETGSLRDAGVQSGESVVILRLPETPVGLSLPPSKVPGPQEIRKAISEYAAKHGKAEELPEKENSVHPLEGLPSTDRRYIGTEQLQEIIDALEERVSQFTSQQSTESPFEETMLSVPHEQDIRCISELMNIPLETARKALILNRNNPTMALQWIVEHQDEEDFHEPLSEEVVNALDQVTHNEIGERVDPEFLAQVMDMGFTEEQISQALTRTHNVEQLALGYLLTSTTEIPLDDFSLSIAPEGHENEHFVEEEDDDVDVLVPSRSNLESDEIRSPSPGHEVPQEAPPTEEEETTVIDAEMQNQGAFDDLHFEELERQISSEFTELDGHEFFTYLRQLIESEAHEQEFSPALDNLLYSTLYDSDDHETRMQVLELLRMRIHGRLNDQNLNIAGPSYGGEHQQ